MSLLFLLVSCVPFAFTFVFWKTLFQRNTGEMSSNSTSLALVRSSSSTQSTKSNTDQCLSVNSQWDNNLPNSITVQRKIFVNLSIVEYNLAELE
ncbi:kita-kyushu lung cancer antigen 1 [Physeter macrocephalus]|uniref:Kita-kyushu lung cancer antigen 1 n=1 Tax=Physeter macrocephalus TaxID=9755 RepID=A0A2Y9F9E5_PHYMC|nr:kita-kyushu lung cancer antigen 1 [Physeter catodon]|eukprot:XP_007117746.1 kita-kyushu lung cancer antigen 1 [Physeter catodon]